MLALPPDPAHYNALVWEIVRQIPPGQVSTFGQIATMIPPPAGVDPAAYKRMGPRWVGKAMNLALLADQVPWQRVVNSQGKIAMPEGSKGAVEQRRRLDLEGIPFSFRDKIDLNMFGWEGPPSAWLQIHGLRSPKSLKSKADPTSSEDDTAQLSLF